jgi:hypothetical protein
MKKLTIAALVLFFGQVNAGNTHLSDKAHCFEKSDVWSVEFFYGNMLMVTTSVADFILMTEGCGDLTAAGHFDFKPAQQGVSAVCKFDTVLLQHRKHDTYGSCTITEILKEDNAP